MNKERRLGRGLEALLSAAAPTTTSAPTYRAQADVVAADGHASNAGEFVRRLSVHEIDRNPFQPRHDFDDEELTQLTQSLREHGLLQPLVVRRVNGRVQLISGERRLRAAISAGWSDVPVIFREADDRETAELAIIENLQRKDLNALEKAHSFQRYLNDYRCTQDELARRLNVDRSTIANLIRLLDLPDELQTAIQRGTISQGHGRALLPLGDERDQAALGRRIKDEGLSVRETERIVQEMISANDQEPLAIVDESGKRRSAPLASKRPGRHAAEMQAELAALLGAKVEIRAGGKGSGKIVIPFKNADEFERIRCILKGEPRRSAASL